MIRAYLDDALIARDVCCARTQAHRLRATMLPFDQQDDAHRPFLAG